jgi:cyclopropane fatty-acyl-phospholipid synthase-like methyltransferase
MSGRLIEVWQKDTREIARRYREKIDFNGLNSVLAVDNRSHADHMAFFSALFDAITLCGEVSILDIGCGKAELIDFLRQKYPSVCIYRYLGLDVVGEFIDYAHIKYPEYTFKHENFLQYTPMTNQKFDLVVAIGVLVKRVHYYHQYMEFFIQKMITCSSALSLFNVITNIDPSSYSYLAPNKIGHSAPFSIARLNSILSKLPNIFWESTAKQIYPDAEDLFVRISKQS